MEKKYEKLETELKQLIIDILALEDVSIADIDSEAPLFVEGLSLDSIDALEIAVAIKKKYGISVTVNDKEAREVFVNIRNLAEYILNNSDLC